MDTATWRDSLVLLEVRVPSRRLFIDLWSSHRFACSLLGATVVHIAVLLAIESTARSPTLDENRTLEVDLELSLVDEAGVDWRLRPMQTDRANRVPRLAAERASPNSATGSTPRMPTVLSTEHTSGSSDVVVTAQDDAEKAEMSLEGDVTTHVPVAPPSRKQFRLFLDHEDLTRLIELPRSRPPEPTLSPSQRLDRSLATEGVNRSGSPAAPAIAAGYQSAQLAPKDGSAVVEVRVDATGKVIAVRIVGAGQNGSWAPVAADLSRRLQGKTLRTRPKSNGMIARLRIDRGKFTRPAGGIKKQKQAAAIGQESPSFNWDESVQGLKERGGMAPSLGASSDWLRTSIPTKISVLEITFL